ncbi:hypothetical protein ANCCEY_03267 [Ancylostoma ceylanicum]|uniref:EGF-like domain-containing protein n=1 Tax=Ancylostoma ceylanicum TaxID=53326 RepID=A0A0D6M5I6_9BILA|nr:hypothetical protein ANCCEY_03267 [Ancylostoma ceylanicum]
MLNEPMILLVDVVDNGTCHDDGNSATCECVKGYSGQMCAELGSSTTCNPNPCRNGGECEIVEDNAVNSSIDQGTEWTSNVEEVNTASPSLSIFVNDTTTANVTPVIMTTKTESSGGEHDSARINVATVSWEKPLEMKCQSCIRMPFILLFGYRLGGKNPWQQGPPRNRPAKRFGYEVLVILLRLHFLAC